MQYTEEFKQKVRNLFPNEPKINELLEKNSLWLGEHISTPQVISIHEVLKATTLDEIRNKAIQIKLKSDLYEEWYNTYRRPLNS